MSFISIILTAFYISQNNASFLQCSTSNSLESLDELQDLDYTEKQGILCPEWPFYSGGFAKHERRSSSDSSSSSEEDHPRHHRRDHDPNDPAFRPPLLPDTVPSNSILYGFDDSVETHQCVAYSIDNYCSEWVTTKQEYADKHGGKGGCDRNDAEPVIITEYQLCLCADTDPSQYCNAWACLETAEYPNNYDAYSVIIDNTFITKSSSSSSSSDESREDEEGSNDGDYYRFVKDGVVMELDESMELSNCWCKTASSNGEYCMNWYCESLQHDEHGCHKAAFGVNDYGWFGCYKDTEDINSTVCNEWYGFLIDNEERDEYRCECADDACGIWVCGLKEIPLRQNYLWHNFWLALILWGCLCGCCGTKMCFKKKFKGKCWGYLQSRKYRMCLFYVLFGAIVIIHGGVPAFVFFVLMSSCSLYCAYKCENCKCCSSECSMTKKWEEMKKQCEMRCEKQTNDAQTDTVVTAQVGENSKEESPSKEVTDEKATKSGHIRVASVEMDGDETMV